ncbi:hypothetical protein HMPREF9555_00688 [Selenomonas artemidis F0399]|uniref:Uncharacterized protein n=1 Tax=Selenomonas artemidis F0399 TaxID=749551 RepID=E7N137_9FIRM|nr:hypothetical protein HMPREF9555_00688 [Selenomonas artemidis F0399]
MTWWGILGITAAGPHRFHTDFPVTSFLQGAPNLLMKLKMNKYLLKYNEY